MTAPIAPPKAPSGAPPQATAPATTRRTMAPQATAPVTTSIATRFNVTKGRVLSCERIGIYGEGKVGKTTLANNLTHVGITPLFIDLEDGSVEQNIEYRVGGITNWETLREVMKDTELRKDCQAVVIDPMTKVEELGEDFILRTTDRPKGGGKATSFRQFGWDGPSYNMERFLEFLSLCDAIRRTHHVVLISHLTTEKVPNAGGDDYLCYQPRLQKASNADCRSKFREYCSHLLYLEYMRDTQDNKATGGGLRIVRTQQAPHYWAGSRSLKQDVEMTDENDPSVWAFLFNQNQNQDKE